MVIFNMTNKNAILLIVYFIFLTIKNFSLKLIDKDNIFSCSEGLSGQNCDGI